MSGLRQHVDGIKRCPFCGAIPTLEWAFNTETYRVECPTENCYASETIISFDTEKEALDAWNRRAAE